MELTTGNGTAHLTAEIVSAYVTKHKVGSGELANLIERVHIALVRAPAAAAGPKVDPVVPSVPIQKSVMRDYIICLDDGRRFKSLKRHLAKLGMTPDEYRTKWNLPRSYPMVAPSYAEKRSTLAKGMGLGLKKPDPAAKTATAKGGRVKRSAKRKA